MRRATSASTFAAPAYEPAERAKRRRAARSSMPGERALKRCGDCERAPIAHRRAAYHQADRRRAHLVARHARRAAIEEIDEPRIAQDAHVPARIVVHALFGFGDR